MEKLQTLLREPYRVEVYNSHFVLYNQDTSDEIEFDKIEEVISYLESL
jgi:hypothetical protein